uniref:Large ribosomal subunit protein uL22c n=1 Tax=Asteropeia rhopaloides TaxID=2518634 RepID=A0A411K264_9CARY|nr:ribosomal protein L22 [Asteropeia rhopaloides]QBC71443.1 ribosomal protein L22 [Asteropeia rhopaloides]
MIKKRKKKYAFGQYTSMLIKKRKEKEKDEVYALGQYIPMSAHKARRIIDQIRGRFYGEALMILGLMPYRACYPIFKLMYSAAANSRTLTSNQADITKDLFISKVEVNKGTTRKKLKPRARGRSYLIKRPTCHIRIVFKDIFYYQYEKFNMYFRTKQSEMY